MLNKRIPYLCNFTTGEEKVPALCPIILPSYGAFIKDKKYSFDRVAISVAARVRIDFCRLDPDPGGQKWLAKIEKVKKFRLLKCWMFSFESWGFFCNLDILRGGIGISILQIFFLNCKFSYFFSHHYFGAGSRSTWNQCGAATLVAINFIE